MINVGDNTNVSFIMYYYYCDIIFHLFIMYDMIYFCVGTLTPVIIVQDRKERFCDFSLLIMDLSPRGEEPVFGGRNQTPTPHGKQHDYDLI